MSQLEHGTIDIAGVKTFYVHGGSGPPVIFIHGGSPGHCFIVMDVVENSQHKKQFLLAQSFMPAQNLQVLQYAGQPWFSMDKRSDIWYGELIDKTYLRRFE